MMKASRGTIRGWRTFITGRDLWTGQYVPFALDHLWRPLTSMSYAVHHWTTGEQAWAFHLVNILLYAIACAAVAEFAGRLAGLRVAWSVGLLFAAHPVHVEPVALVIGRAETLCAAALFIGLCIFVGGALTGRRIIAILLCFVVALLTKEQGILMPVLLAALVPLVASRSTQSRGQLKHQLKILGAAMLWIIAAYGIYREQVIGFPWNMLKMDLIFIPVVRSAGLDRVLLPVSLFGRYIALLFLPLHLAPDYGAWAIGYEVRAPILTFAWGWRASRFGSCL